LLARLTRQVYHLCYCISSSFVFSSSNYSSSAASSNDSHRQSTSSELLSTFSSSSSVEVLAHLFSPPGNGVSASLPSSLPSSTNAAVAYSASDEANINHGSKASSSDRTTPASVSGRITPTAPVVAVSENSNINIAKTGRERGAFAYSSKEHVFILKVVQLISNAFNSGEGSDEWKKVHQEMIISYYQPMKRLRDSSPLHGHFVELYSAFKQGVHTLSVLPNAPKCPTAMTPESIDECEVYITSLLAVLLSDKTKFQSPKWLLVLHLEYLKSFGMDNQNVHWLLGKAEKAKGKYETDKKNVKMKLPGKEN